MDDGVEHHILRRVVGGEIATQWPGDLKTLQFQGGWRDAKTILTHYVQERDDAHRKAFDRLHGSEEESDDVAYG